MARKITYDIVEAESLEALIVMVQLRINEGWKVKGGHQVYNHVYSDVDRNMDTQTVESNDYYSQTLIKKLPKAPKVKAVAERNFMLMRATELPGILDIVKKERQSHMPASVNVIVTKQFMSIPSTEEERLMYAEIKMYATNVWEPATPCAT